MTTKCVSCGVEFTGNGHKCSDEHERNVERAERAAETRAENGGEYHAPAYGQRLAAGFAMLRGCC